MALPITPTPVLSGEDAENFLKRLEEDLKRPAELLPTPMAEEVRKAIRERAGKR